MRHLSAGWHMQVGPWLLRLELRLEDATQTTREDA